MYCHSVGYLLFQLICVKHYSITANKDTLLQMFTKISILLLIYTCVYIHLRVTEICVKLFRMTTGRRRRIFIPTSLVKTSCDVRQLLGVIWGN